MNKIFDRYLRTLAQTEKFPPRELRRYQQILVENLARHAHELAPFYRDRLAVLFDREGKFDFSRWSEVPILTRDNARESSAAMRVGGLRKNLGPVQEIQTSGTSGAPLMLTVNGLARVAYNAALTRTAGWYGADTSRDLAQIRVFLSGPPATYPEGLAVKGWSAAHPEASSFCLDLRTPVTQQIEWLSRRKCPYLMTSPSNAMAISYAATAEQAGELGIEIIFSIGETVIPGARELVARRLGARLVGIYSAEEVGYIAAECPVSGHYHVVAETTLVEIVDDRGAPAKPGESGRVLVSGLYNYATPFIRYEVGDVASFDEAPCACGRGLPVLLEIHGRTRNAFIFRDGRRAWPRAWDARAMEELVPCREFQIVQTTYEMIEFRYVADNSNRVPDIEGLNAYARANLHPSVTVMPVAVSVIKAAPGGKHEPFISMLGR